MKIDKDNLQTGTAINFRASHEHWLRFLVCTFACLMLLLLPEQQYQNTAANIIKTTTARTTTITSTRLLLLLLLLLLLQLLLLLRTVKNVKLRQWFWEWSLMRHLSTSN